MHFVYIIQSIEHEKYYIGSTKDVHKRILKHNLGHTRSTQPYTPYKLIHIEKYLTKKEALTREKQIKSYKGGNEFKKIILEKM